MLLKSDSVVYGQIQLIVKIRPCWGLLESITVNVAGLENPDTVNVSPELLTTGGVIVAGTAELMLYGGVPPIITSVKVPQGDPLRLPGST